MRIDDLILCETAGGFFYDDQAAIRAGAKPDGFIYQGASLTPGFDTIRIPARALGVGLVLSDGAVGWGDMMSVQYAGAGGRNPVFDPEAAERFVRAELSDRLIGLDPGDFLAACDLVLAPDSQGRRLPLSIEYGLSQALLRASAHVRRITMAEVIAEAFGCPLVAKPVPLYAQSGDAREINVDKMILKRVDILPHGLINARSKFGERGEVFLDFVGWTARRIQALATPDYKPTLHFDLYGCIGLEFGLEIGTITDFISRAAERAGPFALNIESPADFGERQAHLDGFAALVAAVDASGSGARIVVDEWCNTLDDVIAFTDQRAAHIVQIKTPDMGSLADTARAVLACKSAGIGAYVGGSCVETDLSARATVHVAVATQADMMLAKPGMGVDEGLSIVGNEQNRLMALLNRRQTDGR